MCSTHWSNRCTKEPQKQCQQQTVHSSHEGRSTDCAKANPSVKWASGGKQTSGHTHTSTYTNILIHLELHFSPSPNKRMLLFQLNLCSFVFEPFSSACIYSAHVHSYTISMYIFTTKAALSNSREVLVCAQKLPQIKLKKGKEKPVSDFNPFCKKTQAIDVF